MALEPAALLVDPTNHRLLIADLAGGLWSFETQALDDVRAGDDPATMAPSTCVGDLGGPVRTMIVDGAGERLTAVLEGGRVVVFDLFEGTRLVEAAVAGAADLAAASGGQRLVVDTTDLSDPESMAEHAGGHPR